MTKKFVTIIYKCIFFFLKTIDFVFKVRASYTFKDIIVENSYEHLIIDKKKIFFYVPNTFTKYRLNSFYKKEPDTLSWIKKFKKNSIFFDIGANIGNYSIYASIKKPTVKIYAFEPSFLNTKVLSRNISINNLYKRIKIIQLPLLNKKNKINTMTESTFEEGGSFNSFGVNKNSGNLSKIVNKYSILGTNLNDLIEKKIIPMPNYIKIDVDGIENLILSGADKILKSKKVKSILIELYPNLKKQYNSCLRILNKSGFKLISNFKRNYIFEKK